MHRKRRSWPFKAAGAEAANVVGMVTWQRRRMESVVVQSVEHQRAVYQGSHKEASVSVIIVCRSELRVGSSE